MRISQCSGGGFKHDPDTRGKDKREMSRSSPQSRTPRRSSKAKEHREVSVKRAGGDNKQHSVPATVPKRYWKSPEQFKQPLPDIKPSVAIKYQFLRLVANSIVNKFNANERKILDMTKPRLWVSSSVEAGMTGNWAHRRPNK